MKNWEDIMSYFARKADFYYGSFLSVLINNGGKPAIVEVGDKRNIYEITTDNRSYITYAKYVVNSNEKDNLWNITFSRDEIEEIKKLKQKNKELLFVSICTYKKIKTRNTEMVILNLKDFEDCIDLNCNVNSNFRISIRKMKNSPNYQVYGTHRADKIDKKDNTIKVPRRRIIELWENNTKEGSNLERENRDDQ